MTFDRVLQPGVLDHNNWWIRQASTRHNGAAPCTAAGYVVHCRMGAPLFDPGLDVANYAPPPFDVVSSHGVPAAPFADFPLTVV